MGPDGADRGLPLVGVTLGEAAGIGPEVAVRGALSHEAREVCRPLLIGPEHVVGLAARACGLTGIAIRATTVDGYDDAFTGLQVFDTGGLDPAAWSRGELSAAVGRSAAHDTAVAVRLATEGEIDAIASGPVNKRALELGGQAYPGQTGYLEALTGSDSAMTILVGGVMRVALLTSHLSLRAAIDAVTRRSVHAAGARLDEALRTAFGIPEPRIGIAALNPHASDDGLMGSEESAAIIPAIHDLREAGVLVTGPVPADAFFLQGDHGAYDGMLALYHDQGVVPLKRHAYATTAYGLPVIRTTVGHGTAYDIAGRGDAAPTAMIHALQLASSLVAVKATGTRVGIG